MSRARYSIGSAGLIRRAQRLVVASVPLVGGTAPRWIDSSAPRVETPGSYGRPSSDEIDPHTFPRCFRVFKSFAHYRVDLGPKRASDRTRGFVVRVSPRQDHGESGRRGLLSVPHCGSSEAYDFPPRLIGPGLSWYNNRPRVRAGSDGAFCLLMVGRRRGFLRFGAGFPSRRPRYLVITRGEGGMSTLGQEGDALVEHRLASRSPCRVTVENVTVHWDNTC